MRADLRDRLRQARDQSDDAASDERERPVVFSGPVNTVILRQDIQADTVHIAGQPPEEEKPPPG